MKYCAIEKLVFLLCIIEDESSFQRLHIFLDVAYYASKMLFFLSTLHHLSKTPC